MGCDSVQVRERCVGLKFVVCVRALGCHSIGEERIDWMDAIVGGV